jgi:hypothetical protein
VKKFNFFIFCFGGKEDWERDAETIKDFPEVGFMRIKVGV